jgi:hypothetical protein
MLNDMIGKNDVKLVRLKGGRGNIAFDKLDSGIVLDVITLVQIASNDVAEGLQVRNLKSVARTEF